MSDALIEALRRRKLDYTTGHVLEQARQNQRKEDFDNSIFGLIHNWATEEQRQPVQLPDDASLLDQAKEAGLRVANLPMDMVAGGAKTMAHWLGSAAYPEMVEPLDMLAPLGIGAMAGMAGGLPSNSVGIFGGKLAKTADHAALARAEQMAAQGVDRDTIWKDTGWGKGVDGQWRFEIDDSGMRLKKTLDELDGVGRPMASDLVWKHDDLFSAYPQLGDVPWYRTPNMEAGGASYDAARGIRIGSGDGWASGKNGPGGMTLHEQQHAVQDIDGFAKGGNRDMGHSRGDVERMAKEAYEINLSRKPDADDELLAELGIASKKPTKPWDSLTQREQMEWWDAGRGRAYNNLAGEVEARTVQKRMDLTADERRSRPMWYDYDVPENQQIVRFNADQSRSSLPGLLAGAVDEQPQELDLSAILRMLQGAK